MNYSLEEYKISDLVKLIDDKMVDLSPPYQRKFIWSPGDQCDLVDSIIKGYPLPNFFLYQKPEGDYEMVDGQQRSRTIYRFIKGLIKSSKSLGSLSYSDCSKEEILNYRIPFIIIRDLKKDELMNDFYVLINKKGLHVNLPETNKSAHLDSNFLKLAEEVLDYQSLIELNLFTDATSKRMNDRAFIEELLAYLKHGIKDKKDAVEKIYKEEDISNIDAENLKERFYSIIDRIKMFNDICPIAKTRWKQKNDFYTLFSFINEFYDTPEVVQKHQFKILILLDGKDKDGLQLIRPTNNDCEPLKEYALNCVSQSNSKRARQERLAFFHYVLNNRVVEENNPLLPEIMIYLMEIFSPEKVDLVKVDGYKLIDVDLINS